MVIQLVMLLLLARLVFHSNAVSFEWHSGNVVTEIYVYLK